AVVVGKAPAAQPPAPEADGGVEPPGGIVDTLGADQVRPPGEGSVGALPRTQRVTRADAACLDAQRQAGAQADGLTGAGGVGDMTAVVDQGPLSGRAPVVEGRLAHQLDLDLA